MTSSANSALLFRDPNNSRRVFVLQSRRMSGEWSNVGENQRGEKIIGAIMDSSDCVQRLLRGRYITVNVPADTAEDPFAYYEMQFRFDWWEHRP